jgi:alpha-beta hydrolase superfamily lysophospholipase
MDSEKNPLNSESIRVFLEENADHGVEGVEFETPEGGFAGRYHIVQGAEAAILWLGGVGGGFDGPARGMYGRLAESLRHQGVASLRLDYRKPGELVGCVVDALAGVEFLALEGHGRIALVGHSFGGAVAISVGAASERVAAVAALSSQTNGTSTVPLLSPRPVLLMHGMADTILSAACSRDIYGRAAEPKELRLYQGCGHGLDECQGQVDRDLSDWLLKVLAPQPLPAKG